MRPELPPRITTHSGLFFFTLLLLVGSGVVDLAVGDVGDGRRSNASRLGVLGDLCLDAKRVHLFLVQHSDMDTARGAMFWRGWSANVLSRRRRAGWEVFEHHRFSSVHIRRSCFNLYLLGGPAGRGKSSHSKGTVEIDTIRRSSSINLHAALCFGAL